jgi:hypothetical protein
VTINLERLNEIREGGRGIALALYIDVDEEEWEDYSMSVPTVLALEAEAGKRMLDALRNALEAGSAAEVSDDASDAVSIVLASAIKDQVMVARLLDGLGGRLDNSLDPGHRSSY